MITKSNLYENLPQPAVTENFETLLKNSGFSLERIVSHAHATPEGVWYDEELAEWVLLLQGSASLRVENQPEPILLAPGDYVHIPSHLRHRVEWTDEHQATVWLALHYRA